MEEKDLTQDMKKEVIQTEKYYENIRLELNKIVLENVTIQEKNTKYIENDIQNEVTEYGIILNFNDEDVKIGTIDENGKIIPNYEILNDEKYTDEDKRKLGDMLNLLGLEQDEVDLSKIQEQLKEIDAKSKEENEKGKEDKKKEKSIKDAEDKEQDGSEEEQENEEIDDPEKQEIAKKFDVNPKDVVHLDTRNEKITTDQSFSELVRWAEGKQGVYVVANKLGSIEKVVEKTENGYEEVEHNMRQMHGEYPNVDIHLVGDDEIKKIVPLKIYQIDSKQALATIRNEWGELETIYCRKQEGEEKYWGSKVPELSGKNVRQMEYDQRELMSDKYNSGIDLDEKADKFEEAEDLEKRGVPTEQKGVQEEKIGNNSYAELKNKIVEDLMKREGVKDKRTKPTGYFEHKADKIIKLMDENKKLQYEEAVESVENSQQRKPGGMTRGEKRNRT